MADDTANVTPEPGPVTATHAIATDDPPTTVATATEAAATIAPPEVAARDHEAVEVVGRTESPVATAEQHERVPVLVGAASAASAAGGDRGGRPHAAEPGFGRGSDEPPAWSFRESAAPRSIFGRPVDDKQVELPFSPTSEPAAPAAPRPLPMFGPVAPARAAMAVPLLAAISLGVYAIAWHRTVNRELEEFDPKLHARPVRSAVAVAIPWLVGLLVSIAGAVYIVAPRIGVHVPLDAHVTTPMAYGMLAGLLAVPYLTLLLPFSVVAVVMTMERLRCVEEHVGITTDRQVRPVRQSLLLALPVVGGLMMLGLLQRRLNAVWDSVAPSGRASA